MEFTIKNIMPKVKNLIIGGFFSGFFVGCCLPNKLYIDFEGKRYKHKFSHIELPIMSGIIGSAGIIFSPILMVNYFCNSTYFDRFIDKYDIIVKKYHQYDGKHNKYAYPSLLMVKIKYINPENE
jgi:hypothetical protein